MRDNDGRKLDHATLAVLRRRAVEQVQAGVHPEQVAETLGLHRKTVYGWVAKFRAGGWEALEAKPVPGRPPTLTGDQLARLYSIIVGTDPHQLEFEFALWTRNMIREVIGREFGVTMSEVTVGRWLKAMGLSPQKPLYRAYQADPEAVEQWKSTTFPKIQKQAKKAKATIYFTDEASVRSDYHAGTTWAPVGRTPVVAATGARFSVNMISAISAKGALRFSIIDGTLTATKFIDFCKRLLRDNDGPVFLILDGHPVHRSKAVTAFADSTGGQLTLFRIPAYSPQLNPDEWVWKNVKHDRIGRSGITGPDQFKTLCTRALRRLQRMPHLVRGFFADPHLAYIRAAA
ncbi:IS630 family transposase [Rhodococcus sp. NPDC127530]|uniref:IS630 family transposase n=1 Tax=unclassified Rhodococcus (in: high G+C Gram-positive bacteria) TaxID=192944 RepID=UPI00362A044E